MKAPWTLFLVLAAAVPVAQADPLTVSIGDVVVKEGDPGQSTQAIFVVELSAIPPTPVAVGWATQDVTATASADYTAASGAVVFDGARRATISIGVIGDSDTTEGAEAFHVRLTLTPITVTRLRSVGHGVIADDDAPDGRHPRCDLSAKSRSSLMAFYTGEHGEDPERHNPQHEDWGPHAPLVEPAGAVEQPTHTAIDAQMVAMEDFDGNGTCDVAWELDDELLLTFTEPGKFVRYPIVSLDPAYPTPGVGWQVIGSGHFNADEAADILWFNPEGEPSLQLWLGPFPDGPVVSQALAGGSHGVPLAVADLYGTGAAGIVWGTAQGGLRYSAVTGFKIATPAGITRRVGDVVDAGWTLGAVGDFDGDGSEDLAWQDADGRVAFWFMRGVTRRGETLVNRERLMLEDQVGIVRGPR